MALVACGVDALFHVLPSSLPIEAVPALPRLCRQLLAGSRQQRQQGLVLLVQFAAPLLAPEAAAGGSSRDAAPAQQQWQGAQDQPAFWELLRGCLCDADASSRKRAGHVLRLALQAQEPDGELGCLRLPLLLCMIPASPIDALGAHLLLTPALLPTCRPAATRLAAAPQAAGLLGGADASPGQGKRCAGCRMHAALVQRHLVCLARDGLRMLDTPTAAAALPCRRPGAQRSTGCTPLPPLCPAMPTAAAAAPRAA